ncbi:MAG: hypothetical protein MUE64_08340 [Ignavibacteriaceae bacterium]|nr:hypothetical protein [Ignavibacteriaceae bacterium]
MDPNETITPTEETTNDAGELSHSDKMIGVFTELHQNFHQEIKIGLFRFLYFLLLWP